MQNFKKQKGALFCFPWILILIPCYNPLQALNSLSQTSFGFRQTNLACRLMQLPAPERGSILNKFKMHTFTIRISWSH